MERWCLKLADDEAQVKAPKVDFGHGVLSSEREATPVMGLSKRATDTWQNMNIANCVCFNQAWTPGIRR